MKLKSLLNILVFIIIYPNALHCGLQLEHQTESYEWAIIGAGLAGITALAVLMDCGVDPSSIVWIDPEFNVGRVGKYYRNVPGNVQTSRLILYVETCPYFKEIKSPSLDALYTYNLDEFQPLHVIADPLLDFTAYLRDKVPSIQSTVTSLDRIGDHWMLIGPDYSINTQKVILAIGAEPKELGYNIPTIPLDDAIDQQKIATYVSPDDHVAVFGGMHSAILILKYLSELPVKQITNFYMDPYFYDAPGLEGITALWAKTVLEQNPPKNLSRVLNTPANRDSILPTCTKVVYAIGYTPSPIMVNGTYNITFDEHTGMIAKNLYGIGIAFPPTGIINGHKVAKNGLHTYLNYAKKLVPQWIVNERFKESISSQESDLPWI